MQGERKRHRRAGPRAERVMGRCRCVQQGPEMHDYGLNARFAGECLFCRHDLLAHNDNTLSQLQYSLARQKKASFLCAPHPGTLRPPAVMPHEFSNKMHSNLLSYFGQTTRESCLRTDSQLSLVVPDDCCSIVFAWSSAKICAYISLSPPNVI